MAKMIDFWQKKKKRKGNICQIFSPNGKN